jgi:GT2 family glycosyltransferase
MMPRMADDPTDAPEVGPTVTIVIVNYNGAHLLPRCLASVREHAAGAVRVDVVVVDNASEDDSVEVLERDWPEVHVMRSPHNMGFAGGNNLALRAVTTDYVLLLNSDAWLERDALAELLAAAESPAAARTAGFTPLILLGDHFRPDPQGEVHARAGTFAPDPEGPIDLVNSTGNVVLDNGFGADRGWLEVRGEQARDRTVFGFCGAAALLRRRSLDEVGLFDDDYFMYYEDTDLSWRLRRLGWDLAHVPTAVVRHEHAATSREGSALFRFHDDRNRLLTLVKHASWPLLLRTVPRYPLTAASLLRAEWPALGPTRVRLRVLRSLLPRLPRALVQRRSLERRATVSRREVERLLTPARRPLPRYRASISS